MNILRPFGVPDIITSKLKFVGQCLKRFVDRKRIEYKTSNGFFHSVALPLRKQLQISNFKVNRQYYIIFFLTVSFETMPFGPTAQIAEVP